MNRFAELCSLLSQTSNKEYKEILLKEYLKNTPDEDIIWALFLLSGKKLSKQIGVAEIWDILPELSGVPEWLINESLQISGDKAETISLLLPEPGTDEMFSLGEIMEFITELEVIERSVKFEKIINILGKLTTTEKFYFIRLIAGSFQSYIEIGSIVNVLCEKYKLEEVSAYHLLNYLDPFQNKLKPILSHYKKYSETIKTYPFNQTIEYVAAEISASDITDWQAEWKWDGMRVQLVYRNNELLVWSKQGGLITEKFPELFQLTKNLPNGTVLDGEIIAFSNGKPLPFNILQNRLNKKVTKTVISEAPIAYVAYDILEHNCIDIRNTPFIERRKLLESLFNNLEGPSVIYLSPMLEVRSWKSIDELKENSLQYNCKGVILKRKDSDYSSPGNRVSMQTEPFLINGVLLYTQMGINSNKFTDFTFGIWHEDELISFAKTSGGLSYDELNEIEAFIKENTLEKFGPVRTVKPKLVFEIQFDGVFVSKRHKAGVTLRNPRVNRWFKNKKPDEAGHLSKLKELQNDRK